MHVKQVEDSCQDREGWTSSNIAAHQIINTRWYISRLWHETTTASLLQFSSHNTAECGPRLHGIAVNCVGGGFFNNY